MVIKVYKYFYDHVHVFSQKIIFERKKEASKFLVIEWNIKEEL